MIEKLKSKIFWIIQISLTSIIIGIIILYSILNYKNTIRSANIAMDRFIGEGIINNEKLESSELRFEGIYVFSIDDRYNIIRKTRESSNDIDEYAIYVSKTGKRNGIISKYIYDVKKVRNNEIEVTLIENEDILIHLNVLIASSIIIGIFSIVGIYFIAKKVSKTIVKPVEDTLQKQKQFISDASHELKTPLAIIEANADVLENEVGENKWILYIQNEIDSMNKLVNDLLLLAKTEDINIKGYSNFNLSDEVKITTSAFESMAYENKIKLNTNIQDKIGFYGQKEDIKHILSTLIDNAIKHTNKENCVIVELSKEKNEIKLQVKNEGEPIPFDEREKIFERFYRTDKSRNRNEKRYGLGLAIAKQTVQKYNGTIEVRCDNNITDFIVKFKE